MTKTSRTEIVAAARDLMRDKGYAGTSMKDVADRVGLLKGSLYSHFSGKDALVPEILSLTCTEMLDGFGKTGEWRHDYEAAIDSIVAVLGRHHRCIGLHLAYGLDTASPDLHQAVAAFFETLHAALLMLLQQGTDAVSADALALDTITLTEGATLWLALHQDDRPLLAARQHLLARADSLAIDDLDEKTRCLLDRTMGDWRQASLAEKRLASRLAATEDELLTVRAALAGQIEAESCFR